MQTPYVNKLNKSYTSYGFTIVELLIVIVVIAILATISISAYTNFQQRAKNTAIINAASQSLKMIQAYIVEHGTYPLKSRACITTESECQSDSNIDTKTLSSETFDANMEKIGTLPKSVPSDGPRLYGITYTYNSVSKFNDVSQPAYLRYYLFGKNQKCGVPGVMRYIMDNTFTDSTTGYYVYDTTYDKTWCYVNIPGPTHS